MKIKTIFRDERGVSLVLTALMLTVLLGFSALVVDIGGMYVDRRRAVTATDAAALAEAKELALGASHSSAVSAARAFAEENGADFTDDIAVETISYNGQSLETVRANVGRRYNFTFARALGFEETNVMAGARAVWWYPTTYSGELFPLFYELGNIVPGEEQVLLGDKESPGNWGLLDVGAGKNTVNEVFSGDPYDTTKLVASYDGEGDVIVAYTETGNPQSRIGAIEERMIRAANGEVSMTQPIPVVREFSGEGGKTELRIVGFVPFTIKDVITAFVKGDDNLWWGKGSIYALHGEPTPKLYGGYEVPNDPENEYPKGVIIGEFSDDFFGPGYLMESGSQNEEYNYGLVGVKLIK